MDHILRLVIGGFGKSLTSYQILRVVVMVSVSNCCLEQFIADAMTTQSKMMTGPARPIQVRKQKLTDLTRIGLYSINDI